MMTTQDQQIDTAYRIVALSHYKRSIRKASQGDTLAHLNIVDSRNWLGHHKPDHPTNRMSLVLATDSQAAEQYCIIHDLSLTDHIELISKSLGLDSKAA